MHRLPAAQTIKRRLNVKPGGNVRKIVHFYKMLRRKPTAVLRHEFFGIVAADGGADVSKADHVPAPAAPGWADPAGPVDICWLHCADRSHYPLHRQRWSTRAPWLSRYRRHCDASTV